MPQLYFQDAFSVVWTVGHGRWTGKGPEFDATAGDGRGHEPRNGIGSAVLTLILFQTGRVTTFGFGMMRAIAIHRLGMMRAPVDGTATAALGLGIIRCAFAIVFSRLMRDQS